MTPSERDALVLLYYPYVRRVAHSMKRRLPKHIEADDLISMGTIALIEAVKNYGKKDTDTFPQYVKIRIRGAIVDAIRSHHMFIKRETKNSQYTDAKLVYIDDKILDFELPGDSSPADQLEAQDRRRAINKAVRELSEKDQKVIHMYFKDHLNFADIGKAFCLSESRMSQIMTRILKTLREKLKDHDF